MFHHSRRTGRSDHVVPGNKEYVRGDEIPRPQGGGDGGGREGSPDGSGDDAFEFTLTKEEFLDMFFEDLEPPRPPIKKTLKDTTAVELAARRVYGDRLAVQISACHRRCVRAWRAASRSSAPSSASLEALREEIEKGQGARRRTRRSSG